MLGFSVAALLTMGPGLGGAAISRTLVSGLILPRRLMFCSRQPR